MAENELTPTPPQCAPQNRRDPSVLVVIVNYRTADLTIDCLESLIPERQRVPGMRVVVTDNASGDESVARIEKFLATRRVNHFMEFVPLPKNGGFAYGNNAAIDPALASNHPPDYVLLLNPDTVIYPHAIAELLKFAEARPKVGICGSRLEYPDGEVQCSAFRFPCMLGEFESTIRFGPVSKLLSKSRIAPPIPAENKTADWLAGASMLIRREVFEQIGSLDPAYFMYFEEVDFCLRAYRHGWECWYVPASRVVHLVGQASGVTDIKVKAKRRPAYWFESRRRYFVRNHGWLYCLGCDLSTLLGLAAWRIRCLIQRKPNPDPPHLWVDSLRQSVLFKKATS